MNERNELAAAEVALLNALTQLKTASRRETDAGYKADIEDLHASLTKVYDSVRSLIHT